MTAAIPRPAKSPPAGTVRPGAVTAVVCLALAAVVAAMSSLNVARSSVAVAARLGGAAAAQARTAFADGMHLALFIAAGIVAVAAIAVVILLRGHDHRADGTSAATTGN